MPNQLELLNGFQKVVIDFATKEGICLRDEFATVDDFKRFVLGLLFRMLLDMGIEARDAFDLVFGEGSYAEFVERVWKSARQRQGIAS